MSSDPAPAPAIVISGETVRPSADVVRASRDAVASDPKVAQQRIDLDAQLRDKQIAAYGDRLTSAGLPEQQRNAVLEQLGRYSGPARDYEMRTIDGALASPNAASALRTYGSISDMEDPKGRITPEIRRSLVDGVATPKSDSDRGTSGVLTATQAQDAAESLTKMNDQEYGRLTGSLDRASQETERALILKASGARLSTFNADDANARKGAMDQIEGFAKEIRGEDRRELVRTTTVLDVHDENDSTRDPTNIASTAPDTKGDNDGLYQSFENSCVPTIGQTIAAERDPIAARRIHKEGFAAQADEQRRILEEPVFSRPEFRDKDGKPVTATPEQLRAFQENDTMPGGASEVRLGVADLSDAERQRYRESGALPDGVVARKGVPLSREDAQLVSNQLAPATRRLIDRGVITKDDSRALVADLQGNNFDPAARDRALTAIRGELGGVPSDADIVRLRGHFSDAMKAGGRGMDSAIGLSRATGREYFELQDGQTGGFGGTVRRDDLMKSVDISLANGNPVAAAFTRAGQQGGHEAVIADARGEGANRRYLVHEPSSGRTSWQTRDELANNAFGLKFQLNAIQYPVPSRSEVLPMFDPKAPGQRNRYFWMAPIQ